MWYCWALVEFSFIKKKKKQKVRNSIQHRPFTQISAEGRQLPDQPMVAQYKAQFQRAFLGLWEEEQGGAHCHRS